jgi:hypothetical protein
VVKKRVTLGFLFKVYGLREAGAPHAATCTQAVDQKKTTHGKPRTAKPSPSYLTAFLFKTTQ